MDLITLLISLVSGAVGGNVAGAAMPDKSLGCLGNSLSGILGGGLGGYVLQALGLFASAAQTVGTTEAAPGTGFDIVTLLGNIAGSGVGGAILTIVIGMIKNSTQK